MVPTERFGGACAGSYGSDSHFHQLRSLVRERFESLQPETRNREARAVCEGLFGGFSTSFGPHFLGRLDDITSITCHPSTLRQFDLKRDFGLDPNPLFSLIEMKPPIRQILTEFVLTASQKPDFYAEALLEYLQEINSQALLGPATPISIAGYLFNITGSPMTLSQVRAPANWNRFISNLVPICARTLDLLTKRIRQLDQHVTVPDVRRLYVRMSELLAHVEISYIKSISTMLGATTEWFVTTHADQLVTRIMSNSPNSSPLQIRPRSRHSSDIDVAYVQRDSRFIKLGDRYGDCTAQRVRSQVDPDVANIHWTVYPWLLHPFYRVLEVTVARAPAIKGHILPLQICGKPVLALDAIEAVPCLREKTRDGKDNPILNRHLFERREEIIDRLFDVVGMIGDRMNAEEIHVDAFSNAEWVRERVGRLPTRHYHVSQVSAAFAEEAIRSNITNVLGSYSDTIQVEVQAMNLKLYDQGLKQGYKAVGLLRGDARLSDALPLRGP